LEATLDEVCDIGLDENCNSDCSGCVDGWAWNPAEEMCSLCGNGMAEVDEDCDPAIDAVHCTWMCTCMDTWVSDSVGGCTLCGNGVVDKGEYCDSSDVFCDSDCTKCAPPYVSKTEEHGCTLCGNGIVDGDEQCDSMDYNCYDDCTGCLTFHSPDANGHCTRCGNGLLDAGEECDSASRSGCADNCQSCDQGFVALYDKYGRCSTCGNGVVDADEACDHGHDQNCAGDCSACVHPWASIGRRCLLCGNGLRDVVVDESGQELSGEVCDSSQPGCVDDCTACEDG